MSNILDLTKAFELNLQKNNIFNIPVMATRLAVDKSGSMRDEFQCGWVQNTIDLFIAVAMKFDDNGELDVGFYNTSFSDAPSANKNDVGTYLQQYRVLAEGGTSFAPAIKAMKWKKPGFSFFNKKSYPVYLGFITDGENNDDYDFKKELNSLENTFMQVIAIGNGVQKTYLDSVAQQYKNVSVIYLPNPKSVTVDQFYEQVCNDKLKAFIEEIK